MRRKLVLEQTAAAGRLWGGAYTKNHASGEDEAEGDDLDDNVDP